MTETVKLPDPVPPGFTLRRVSWLRRTVRYEWPGEDGTVLRSPTFNATAQEWDRARER